ncbi:hypothetical protein ABZ801_36850 [Actinomadura sp. NPDC047616]|uniref:phenylacetate--CoA ligase family protein n=1 Tax=Actinomadura sp. NPDC047616 TaxID=3155914 RepID=UPI0033E343BA
MPSSLSPSDYDAFTRRYYSGEVTEADWRRWHAERLTAVLRKVTRRSDFYRAHLSGVDVDAVTPDDLSRLPFTTKDDLREAMFAVLSGPVGEGAIYYETTGTTGPPTPCPRGPEDIARSNAHVEEAWRRLFAAHFGARMPVIALMGPSELYAFGDTFGEVAQRLGACHAKIWPESSRVGFRKALRLLKELRAEVVVCAPALCLSLAKAARHYGYDPREDFGIELFLVLGEICTPEFADNVASIWGARTLPTLYGSQEALAIATGCAEGRMHLSDPNYLVEILDPRTGAVRGRTGTGELCLTMLIDGIKPLVRYRTGDLVTVTGPGCPCGRPGALVEVVGRVADRIELGGGRFHPAEIESAVLRGVRGCLGYQVVIDTAPDGADQVTVRMDLLPDISGPPHQVGAGVAERLRELAGVRAAVVADGELDPVTNTGAYVSWKAARILDNRTEPDDAALVARQVAHRYAIAD